ncbi:histidine kinase [Lysobacter arseniciresistens ZS79]|uniref:histidine kinase n=1 Tax=Lysobacter arseniciresistens ZS79 TaxID=913325 RepID=A0A0A0F4M5_9GAMM|nr:ATP-binding protein [Lysobacter arseniciresistens]KGM57460.1 histidine kinase [Lysobacter arseniciresistens ZS79]
MPNTGVDNRERWHLPALGVTIIAIVLLPFAFLADVLGDSAEAALQVDHTRRVETTIYALTYDIRNNEAALLALVSGINTPLIRARLAESTARIPAGFKTLAELTRDDPDQQLRVGELKGLLERRAAFVDDLLADTSDGIPAEVGEIVVRYPVRELTDQILAKESQRLKVRRTRADRLRQQAEWLMWATMFAQLLLFGLVVWLSQRHSRRRLESERDSRRANARALSVLQTVREPIALVDERRHVIMHNRAFAELYGDAAGDGDEDLRGQPLAEVGGGAWSDAAVLQRLTDVLVRGRELWDYEHHQTTRDGSERVMLLNARRMPLPDRDDRVVLLTISDITAAKATENRIRELNQQLEGKVEQVSDVNRELEAFSYSVSHDLRAPLRHVAGFADKLGRHLGDNADDKSRHYIDVIGSSARRMSTLIDDLLVYSRLGRSAMRLQAVDMQSMAAETRAILDANAEADSPGRRIEWRIAPLPILVGDENMLRQVWLNLLGNAVKYSANRDPAVIEVSHQRLDDGSHHFSVRDNGAGFDMQYAGKLFGVFQRMHKASEYPGTGIGLASVRRVLMRHGGKIWAEAEPDAGATFHFTLPATLDPNQKQEPRT